MSNARKNERRTFCRICAASCGMIVTLEGHEIIAVRGDPAHPASLGYSCPKGRALGDVYHSPRRLDHPLLSGRRASWDDLLGDLAARLAALRSAHGPDSIGYYSATGQFPDKAGVFAERRFFHALGTRQAYTAASVDVFPAFKAAELITGYATDLQPVWEPEQSPRLTIIVGQNPVVSHGYLTFLTDPIRRIRAYRRGGGRLWVLDPRRSETAQLADVHLAPRPGTDGLVLAWLVRELLDDGADREELEGHADPTEVASLRRALDPFTLDAAAAGTGIDAPELTQLLAEVRRAGQIACLPGTGVTFGPHAIVTDCLVWLLLIVTGSLDRPGGMRFAQGVIGAANERTAWQPAAAGGSNTAGPPSRPELPRFLGEYPVAALADEIESGSLRALVIAGGNPLTAVADPQRTEAALRKLDALVVIDVLASELTDLATHVVPGAHQLERADLTLRDRVSYTPAVVPLGADRRPVWWFHAQLARRLGIDLLSGLDPDHATDDDVLRLLVASAPTAGNTMKVDATADGGEDSDLFSRIVAAGTAGLNATPALGWAHERALPDRRWRVAPQTLIERLPLLLAEVARPARVRLVSIRQKHRVNSARYAAPDDADVLPEVVVHPADAAALAVGDGDAISLTTASGTVTGRATVTAAIRPGAVSVTHGLTHANVNRLIAAFGVDELTGQPAMSAIEVDLGRAADSEGSDRVATRGAQSESSA